MLGNKLDLQRFADLESILEQNKEAFTGMDGIKDQFGSISTKLNELGFEVLINNKKESEFIPYSRFKEVGGQRDQFKAQVEDLNKQLQALSDGAKGNEELQKQLQTLMDNNSQLLSNLETVKVESEILLTVKDELAEGVDPKDILVFINKDKIKVSDKGITGVKEEIERLKTEKAYFFKKASSKGGSDRTDNQEDPTKSSMNFLIRNAMRR